MAALPCFLLASCLAHDDIRVAVTYERNALRELDELTVIAGGSKISWGMLSSGNSVRARLSPMGEPAITLIYKIAGEKRSWHGPAVSSGTGYDIDIHIAADGSVTAQHCVRPCDVLAD